MLKKLLLFLFLCALVLTACEPRPYGHYEDDKMIGTVSSVDPDNSLLDVDISEWHKRHQRGDIEDYGVALMIPVTNDLVIKQEDGQLTDMDQIKPGQKVLINPPQSVRDEHFEAEEVILLEMNHTDKFDRLLSKRKDHYRTTIFLDENEWISEDMEEKLRGSVSNYGVGTLSKDYVVNYEEELDIRKYPVMLVFDDEELVLKTYEVDELVEFFDSLPDEE